MVQRCHVLTWLPMPCTYLSKVFSVALHSEQLYPRMCCFAVNISKQQGVGLVAEPYAIKKVRVQFILVVEPLIHDPPFTFVTRSELMLYLYFVGVQAQIYIKCPCAETWEIPSSCDLLLVMLIGTLNNRSSHSFNIPRVPSSVFSAIFRTCSFSVDTENCSCSLKICNPLVNDVKGNRGQSFIPVFMSDFC